LLFDLPCTYEKFDFKLFKTHSIQNLDFEMAVSLFDAGIFDSVIVLTSLDKEIRNDSILLLLLSSSLR